MPTDEYVAETWEHAGCTIKIVQDMDPIDPRKDYDHETVMFCDHGRYELGDEDTGIDKRFLRDHCDSWQDVLQVLKDDFDAYLWAPLYLIDHSGIAMRTGPFIEDPGGWDSGMVGWIFFTEEKLREQWCLTADEPITDEIRAKAIECLEGEVKEYSAYLEGDCVGWVVERNGEVVDSCWGYLDYYAQKDYIKSEANAVAEHEQKNAADYAGRC
jgi:hypothetical protein